MKLVLLAVFAVAVPHIASADRLVSTREQPLAEVSHSVVISIADGVATYKVQRQFANSGKVADEAGLAIDLPAGGAATGLRIRARDKWYDGELMEREAAAALYKEMTGFGAYAPKDPALLQWLWADKLYLQVFPVMPGQVSTVEYTLTVPTRYQNGRYYLSYPRFDPRTRDEADTAARPMAVATVQIDPSWGDAQTMVSIDNQRIAPGTPFVLTPPARPEWSDLVAMDPSGSYVASSLVVPAGPTTNSAAATAELVLDISHTYSSDLRVELVTPQGQVIALMSQSGGGANVLKSKRTLTLPAGTIPAGTWRLVASDHAGLDTGSIDTWSLTFGRTVATATDTPVFIPDAPESAGEAGVATIAVEPPVIKTWLTRFGRVVASKQHAFGRLEVDIAPQLSELPKRAQIVFVVDASYSVGEENLGAQLDVIRAYVAHVPDAEVEIVATRRQATRVFGSFVGAKQVETKLAAARAGTALALGNGSALDEAAKLAVSLVEARKGPRRIVLLTDELVRSSLSAPATLASLAKASKDTVVHVVVPQTTGYALAVVRDDTAPLAALATKHRGIFARIEALYAKGQKELVPVVLELVRPTKLENVVATGAAIEEKTLPEGAGVRLMLRGQKVTESITLSGELWSTPVTKTLKPTTAFTKATAAFIFGLDEHQDLTPEEQMKIALLGRAVSPVTSYVAAEPGTRPSWIGLEGTTGTGIGSGYGSGLGGMSGYSRTTPPAITIDSTACVAQHTPATGWTVELVLETTYREIVDVQTSATGPMAACIVEAAWAKVLDDRWYEQRATYEVSVR